MAPLRLDRTLLRASGPEARSFLQGVLTQSVDKLAEGAPLYAALLSPQGKLIADMTLWPEAEGGVLVDADPRRAEDLFRRLGMYKLRAQATLVRVDDVSIVFSPQPFEGASADPRFPNGALGWRALAAADGAGGDGAADYENLRLAVGAPTSPTTPPRKRYSVSKRCWRICTASTSRRGAL